MSQWTFNSKITPLYCNSLIAKIVLNYEFKLEILTLVVLSYCGISNMVSRRLFFYLFLFKYFFACYLFVIRFFFYQLLCLNDSRGMLEKEEKPVNRELKVSDLKISQMGLLM